jgi:hypothetical protein
MDTMMKSTSGLDAMMKNTTDMASFGQGNADAILKSSQIWIAGCRAIGETMVTTARAHFDHAMSTWKAMSDIKSLQDAMDMQTQITRFYVESTMAGAGKLTDATNRLARETMAPITARMTSAGGKYSVETT